jgi:hypothetical protein
MSWRDHLKVHPAADLFPMMSEPELRELGEDIKANGLRTPIAVYKGKLLDGRNRLDAMELVGIKFRFRADGKIKFFFLEDDAFDDPDAPSGAINEDSWVIYQVHGDPYAFVLSANLHRRHLSSEQKRELIAKVLKAKPEASNATVAKQVKADDKTVAKVRRKLESTSEIPKLNKTVGADGKSRPKTKQKKRAQDSSLDKLFDGAVPGRITESAEVSIEDHRAEMARLDEPADSAVDEVDKRVSCVTKTILGHLKGLSRSDAERFIAALRDRLDDLEREQLRDEVAERSEHEIPGDLSVPDFLRRAPA